MKLLREQKTTTKQTFMKKNLSNNSFPAALLIHTFQNLFEINKVNSGSNHNIY